HAARDGHSSVVDDVLYQRRLLVEILARRGGDCKLVCSRDHTSLIIQENEQIASERLPSLFELVGDTRQIDRDGGWCSDRARYARRRSGRRVQRLLDVGDELRVITDELRRQREPLQPLPLELLE